MGGGDDGGDKDDDDDDDDDEDEDEDDEEEDADIAELLSKIIGAARYLFCSPEQISRGAIIPRSLRQ